MKKWLYVLIICVVSDHICKPPNMENKNLSCQTATLSWLTFNIPEFVNQLLHNKKKYQDNHLKTMVEVFEAMKKVQKAEENNSDKDVHNKLNSELQTSIQEFHTLYIEPIKNNELHTINYLFDTYFKDSLKEQLSTLKEPEILNENIKNNNTIIKIAEDNDITKYIYFDYAFLQYIDENNIIQNSPINQNLIIQTATNIVYEYELIGFAVGSKGHAYAYIKDQWEKHPHWYRCNDLGSVEQISTFPAIWPNKTEPWPGSLPTILIYKQTMKYQIPTLSIEQLASALDSLIS